MYDLIIIGAGPAGLTAAIFARRNGLKTLVLNNNEQPSNLAISHLIENWPGNEKIDGAKLLKNIKNHALKFGAEIKDEKVIGIAKIGKNFSVQTYKGGHESKTLILAMGLQHRKASIKGEEEYFGKGVSYCTLCDGPLYKGADVAVVGGGDSAAKAVKMLHNIGAKNIYLIHRREELRAEEALQKAIKKTRAKFMLDSVIEEIGGSQFVEYMIVKNLNTNKKEKIKVSGIFIEVGSVPVAELAKGLGIETDKTGFIKTSRMMETNISGIFAAGDIANGPLKQDITASADGAVAAFSAVRFLK
jgi:thioredoxin reductase (NADPH)